MNTKEHYENHLADFYEWMIGDFSLRQQEQQNYFQTNGIISNGKQIAVDLGSGIGIQSISLAKLGFTVKAFDFNKQLNETLQNRRNDLEIEIIQSDLLFFHDYVCESDLIVCMGDTIAHFDSIKQLQSLLQNCFSNLNDKGKLVLSFRDYSNALVDNQRFIPVKADDNRILTCILDYREHTVQVTDLLYEKQDTWIQKVSCYQKLRLNPSLVKDMVLTAGFAIVNASEINRMHYLIAEKIS